jgi:hypothetical protein
MTIQFIPMEDTVKAKIAELNHVSRNMPMLMDGECIARFVELCMELLAMQAAIAFTTHPSLEVDTLVKQIAVALEDAQDRLYARKNSREHLERQVQHLVH